MRTVPPDCRTTPNTIDRPNPVPLPTSLVVKNGSKARSKTSGLIPVPVSRTDTSTQSWRAISSGNSSLVALTFAVSISTVPPPGIASRALRVTLSSAVSI